MLNSKSSFIQSAEELPCYPFQDFACRSGLPHRIWSEPSKCSLEKVRSCLISHQYVRVVFVHAQFSHETSFLLIGQLRQIGLQRIDVLLAELQRQQIGIGEIAVIV